MSEIRFFAFFFNFACFWHVIRIVRSGFFGLHVHGQEEEDWDIWYSIIVGRES